MVAEYSRATFDAPEDIFQALRATTTIPLLGGPPVRFDGRLLYDGGLVETIPVRSAIAAGATHVLALMTRRADEIERSAGNISKLIERMILKALRNKHVLGMYTLRDAGTNEAIALCLNEARARAHGIRVQPVVIPPIGVTIGRLAKDEALLRSGDRMGQDAIYALDIA